MTISNRKLHSQIFSQTKVFFNLTDQYVHNPVRNKYILQWTSDRTVPFVYMGEGNIGFLKRKCSYTNCIVTNNRSLLGDYTNFDVIVFNGPEIINIPKEELPQNRSEHQKYVFASIESSDNYPICRDDFNNFFNWTWTYKLSSEVQWGYITIRDENKQIVGPKIDMNWLDFEKMKPVSEDVKRKIGNKTKAVAWFVSNCFSRSRRNELTRELAAELAKYDLYVDIYGSCGSLKCSRNDEDACDNMLERDYFFYLSFENSLAEDYVTEKLLHPLKHLTVPIVYGGANYTRFMPDSAYLNVRELGVKKLAEKMNALIENPDDYIEYFRWTNHYSYYTKAESIETDEYCRFCSILSEEDLVKRKSVYENFSEWWNPPLRC
ncbi:alpha-(1,3)-fucosyltransferase C [Pieris rapae]|uniref:alpha-(1,3)-fucosyltransferase C n=1 Tax=Pieris rapae TaxID=64459 RepID=UPI001E27E386|nr:alpha-(1,3)-fucosyltransferase C [Pieris rapae]